MIRVSEAVLPGHPDKLCDFVAESLVQAALAVDTEAYAQIEAGIWCDQLWLSGGYAARGAPLDVESIAVEALDSIARTVNSDAPPKRWNVTNAVCRYDVDPRQWSRHVNDQAIVVGWAGYDAKVEYLPPEHFVALEFRDALWDACRGGPLAKCGPDGKLIVRLREDEEGFALEHVLVTLEHPEALSVLELAERVNAVLAERYGNTRRVDPRWVAQWRGVQLLVNPNGPLSDAGSQKDNGQTGRKLVMDYYGPRVPLGGGAIYGKHPTHVDRFGARVARELAIDAVKRGAGECLVRAVYAPNVAEPLDVQVEVARGEVRIQQDALVLGAPNGPRLSTRLQQYQSVPRRSPVGIIHQDPGALEKRGEWSDSRARVHLFECRQDAARAGAGVDRPAREDCGSQRGTGSVDSARERQKAHRTRRYRERA